jgi:outer membrane protein OmpA-like peptidoglycan-associated protein
MKENSPRYLIKLWLIVGLIAVSTVPLEAGLGKLWPFATKKHIKQQIDPLNGRVTELEEIGKKHEAQIKDVDERAQAGIQTAMNKIGETDLKTQEADRKAESASALANQAKSHLSEVESRFDERIGNVDNYHQTRNITVNFQINKSALDKQSQETLDGLASDLKDSRGYLLEVEGFADPSGPADLNLELSRARAESVVRYMTESHDIPLFRMRTIGMGAIPHALATDGPKSSRKVEIHLLHNDAVEVASK